MTDSELISAYFTALDAVNGNFEFWLTITFAILVSFYYAGNKFPTYLKRLLISIYLVTAFALLLRLTNAGRFSGSILARIIERDADLALNSVPQASFVGILWILIIVAGTIATVYYALRVDSIGNSKSSRDV